MTYIKGTMASTNHTEAFNLLLTGSDSGSDIPDFSLPKRKVRLKRKNRQVTPSQKKRGLGIKTTSSSFCSSTCSTSIFISFIMIIIAIMMVLIWFVVQLRLQIDQLSSKFNTVEASNKGMPEELHAIHTKLNNLQKNYTHMKQNIGKLNDDITNVNKQISDLQKSVKSIKSSIAAAPLIKNLPDDVVKLSENVATIGSKITNVEDKLEKLKGQHSDFDQKHKNFLSVIKQIQDSVSNVESVTDKPVIPTDNNFVNQLNTNLKSLEKQFDKLNITLMDEVQSISTKMDNLSHTTHNLQISDGANSNLSMEMIKNYINSNVKQALIVNIVGGNVAANVSISEILKDVDNITRIYAQLLLKMNQSNVLTSNSSEASLNNIISKFVHMYSNSKSYTDLINLYRGLNVSVTELQNNDRSLVQRLDQAYNLIHNFPSSPSAQDNLPQTTSAYSTS